MKIRAFVSVSAFGAMFLICGCAKRSLDRELINYSGTGNIQEIKRLVAAGANVNCRDGSLGAWTPLMWAAYEHQDEAIQVLLHAGADPNARDSQGRVALSWLDTSADHSAVVKAMILAGATANEYDEIYESLGPTNPNRIAFEEAVKLRNQHASQ
jgi:ankyrin repeat protein